MTVSFFHKIREVCEKYNVSPEDEKELYIDAMRYLHDVADRVALEFKSIILGIDAFKDDIARDIECVSKMNNINDVRRKVFGDEEVDEE